MGAGLLDNVLGEVNLLEPILKRWEGLHPEWDCVISTTTQTGFQLAQKKYGPRTVFYCPLDFTWAVGPAMRRIRPTLLMLAELELWPNLISAAKQHGAKVAVINGDPGILGKMPAPITSYRAVSDTASADLVWDIAATEILAGRNGLDLT